MDLSFPLRGRRVRDVVNGVRGFGVGVGVAGLVVLGVLVWCSWGVGVSVRAGGVGFDTVGVFSVLCAGVAGLVAVAFGSVGRVFSWWLVAGWVLSGLLLGVGVASGVPWWVGVLVGVLWVLVGVLVGLVWVSVQHRVALFGLLESGDSEGFAPFDPREVGGVGVFSRLMFVCGFVGSVAAGVFGGAVGSSVLAVGSPAYPGGGVVTVGEGVKPAVQVLYSVNSPNASILFGDDAGRLRELVREGKISLTVQGTAPGGQGEVARPVLAGEACALELGGQDAWLSFFFDYYRSLGAAGQDASVVELVKAAGGGVEGFGECVDSGRFELSSQRYLAESQGLVVFPYVKVFVNGQEQSPKDLDELVKLVEEQQQ